VIVLVLVDVDVLVLVDGLGAPAHAARRTAAAIPTRPLSPTLSPLRGARE
jgi:hypothetical protein